MTRIGPSFVISGELLSSEDTIIEGRVDGQVQIKGAPLTIAPRGNVRADVRAVRVLVEGQLKGSISASERIELTASAQVEGALSANQVIIIEGARFDGGIDMQRRTIESKVAQYRAQQATGAMGSAAAPVPAP
jgi:cytoskeletal protein CcmA (bactofilin family)